MTKPHELLERIFHEPSRLALLTELCAAKDGLPFVELKSRCNLTDGNLNRHLHALKTAEVIKVEKSFVDSKPRTTVFVTSAGKKQFLEYLSALEEILRAASVRVSPSREKTQLPSLFASAMKATK